MISSRVTEQCIYTCSEYTVTYEINITIKDYTIIVPLGITNIYH